MKPKYTWEDWDTARRNTEPIQSQKILEYFWNNPRMLEIVAEENLKKIRAEGKERREKEGYFTDDDDEDIEENANELKVEDKLVIINTKNTDGENNVYYNPANPLKLTFNSRQDVENYVAKSLIAPTDENFEKVMAKIKNPHTLECFPSKMGEEFIIPDYITTESERDHYIYVMRLLEQNRIRHQKKKERLNKVKSIFTIACLILGSCINSIGYTNDDF